MRVRSGPCHCGQSAAAWMADMLISTAPENVKALFIGNGSPSSDRLYFLLFCFSGPTLSTGASSDGEIPDPKAFPRSSGRAVVVGPRARCGKLRAVGLALPAARSCSPYEAVLGEAFASLHAHVRLAHLAPLRAEGTIDVEHGPGWLARSMIWLMKLPAAGPRQPVRLDVAGDGSELVWTRCIGRSLLRTRQYATGANGSRLVERSGLGRVSFVLAVEDGALLYRHSSIHVVGLPLPSSLSPRVGAVVSATAAGWRVAVTVDWRGRIVCRYAGTLRAL